MSESALALDSGAEDSSPDVGSSQDQSTESSLELFTDDSLDSAQSEDSGHSDAQSDFDPQRHDWLRGSADDVPGRLKRNKANGLIGCKTLLHPNSNK